MTLSLSKLYSDSEFAERFTRAMSEMEAETNHYTFTVQSGYTGMPRASGIASCARKQLLSIVDDPALAVVTNPAEGGALWAPWMGFAGEALVGGVLRRMGYTVEHPDVQGSEWMTGHPDGTVTGLDFGDTVVLWDNKVRGDYAYRMLLEVWRGQKRLIDVDPDMYYQMQCYMHWLKLPGCMVTVTPHDRSLAKRNKGIIEPTIYRIFIEYDAEAYRVAEERAVALLYAKETGMMVNREFDPGNPSHLRFPCGYCPVLSLCPMIDIEVAAGEREMHEVPPLPGEAI